MKACLKGWAVALLGAASLLAQMPGAQIAIAGSELSFDNNYVPVVWKGDQITAYTMPGQNSLGWAMQVLWDQGKWYVLGEFREDGGPSRPIIWADGETYVLPIIPGHSDEDSVLDNGVFWKGFLFMSGTTGNYGVGVPVFYVNTGGIMLLPFPFGMGGGLWTLTADQDLVYGGGLVVDESMLARPSLWKFDGLMASRTELPLPNHPQAQGRVNKLQVFNGELYAAGVHWYSQPNIYFPIYWKDQQPVSLAPDSDTDPTGEATGIAVDANNVYVSGYMLDDGINAKPVLWIGGVRHDLSLPAGAEGGVARDVTLMGNTPVVAGAVFTPDGKSTACYWLNGERVDLPKLHPGDTTDVSSVSIVPFYYNGGANRVDLKQRFEPAKRFQQLPARPGLRR